MRGSGGTRLAWAELPAAVRQRVEEIVGASVTQAVNQAGGFSPGLAARCALDDGRRVFIKATSPDQNRQAARIHRREIEVAELVGGSSNAPALRHTLDDGHWVVLVFDEVDGRQPNEPWTWEDLDRVIPAVIDHASHAPPAGVEHLQRFEDRYGAVFGGWRRLAAGDGDPTAFGADVVDALDQLVTLEDQWRSVAPGDQLLHTDLRADNILVTDAGDVVFVDWPWACRGAPVCELATMLPSIGLGGGPDLGAVVERYALDDHYGADALAAMVCATIGFFARASQDPPPPGLPTVRAFQRAQAEVGLDWLLVRS